MAEVSARIDLEMENDRTYERARRIARRNGAVIGDHSLIGICLAPKTEAVNTASGFFRMRLG